MGCWKIQMSTLNGRDLIAFFPRASCPICECILYRTTQWIFSPVPIWDLTRLPDFCNWIQCIFEVSILTFLTLSGPGVLITCCALKNADMNSKLLDNFSFDLSRSAVFRIWLSDFKLIQFLHVIFGLLIKNQLFRCQPFGLSTKNNCHGSRTMRENMS